MADDRSALHRDSGTPSVRGEFVRSDWFPEWISRLAMPVWVSDSHGKLRFLNRRAQVLLGWSESECQGQPCRRVVCGRQDCTLARRAKGEDLPEPFMIQVRGGEKNGRWLLVFIIALDPPRGSGPWLVHCAWDIDRFHHMEEYLSRVAFRSGIRRDALEAGYTRLTNREREVLDLLVQDQDPHQVAARLHVTYVTVRNHIQHILPKLCVHSVPEAVAFHLLGSCGSPACGSSRAANATRPPGGAQRTRPSPPPGSKG